MSLTTQERKMRRRRWDRAFSKCPGAWLGSMPGALAEEGNITVDAEVVLEAARYLRRYFIILGTRAHGSVDGGILFILAWR